MLRRWIVCFVVFIVCVINIGYLLLVICSWLLVIGPDVYGLGLRHAGVRTPTRAGRAGPSGAAQGRARQAAGRTEVHVIFSRILRNS